jgi:hypothetical protein
LERGAAKIAGKTAGREPSKNDITGQWTDRAGSFCLQQTSDKVTGCVQFFGGCGSAGPAPVLLLEGTYRNGRLELAVMFSHGGKLVFSYRYVEGDRFPRFEPLDELGLPLLTRLEWEERSAKRR